MSPYYTKTHQEVLSRSTEQKFMNTSQRANSNGIAQVKTAGSTMVLNQEFTEMPRVKNGGQSANNAARLFKSTESLPKNENSTSVPSIPYISQQSGTRNHDSSSNLNNVGNMS